jgi:hypothetical protein
MKSREILNTTKTQNGRNHYIPLNIKGLNSSIKRHIIKCWVKKAIQNNLLPIKNVSYLRKQSLVWYEWVENNFPRKSTPKAGRISYTLTW